MHSSAEKAIVIEVDDIHDVEIVQNLVDDPFVN